MNRTFEVPEGYEAVAVQIDFVAGGAGYVNPGDRINIYGVLRAAYPIDGKPRPAGRAAAHQRRGARRGPHRPGPPTRHHPADRHRRPGQRRHRDATCSPCKTADAEKVIYTTEFESLYATLTAEDAPPGRPHPGPRRRQHPRRRAQRRLAG